MPSHYKEKIGEFADLAKRRPDLFTDEQKQRITSSLKMQDFDAELERKFQERKSASAPCAQPV